MMLLGLDQIFAAQYRYNGKELNEDLGLNWIDYGARWYDASLGRWWSVDPLADDYASFSVYNYGINNPIRVIDPTGAYIEILSGGGNGGTTFLQQLQNSWGGQLVFH